MEIFGLSKYISVPLAALGVWLLIVKGSYRAVERIFLIASALYLAYVPQVSWPARLAASSAGFRHPQLSPRRRLRNDLRHRHRHDHRAVDAVLPAGVDCGQRAKAGHYAYERLDVIVGSLFAVFVAHSSSSPARPRCLPTACASRRPRMRRSPGR